jgi:dephospho-CoA kinase
VDTVRRVLFVCLPGSGKTTAAKQLEKRGWFLVSAGDVVREICLKSGLPIDRATLQECGSNLLNEKGEEYFATLLITKGRGHRKVVFEGIRPLGVVSAIREKSAKTLLVFVDASEETRRARLSSRDGLNLRQFSDLEHSSFERQVLDLRNLADVIVENNGSKGQFFKNLVSAIKGDGVSEGSI